MKRVAEMCVVASCMAAVPFLAGCSGKMDGGTASTADAGADSPPSSGTPDPAAGDSGDPGPAPEQGGGTDAGLPAVDCGTSGVQGLVTADTAFATTFLAPAIAQAGGAGANAVVSAYSVSNAMMMVDVGAAGATDSQIESVLSLPGSGTAEAPAYANLACTLEADGSSNGQSFAVANAVWAQQGASFEAPFLSTLTQGYGAPLQTADFGGNSAGAITDINAWVSQATQGNVPSLLGPADVTDKTRMVLVNAVYFKGTWATGFDPSMTGPQPFTLGDGTKEMVTAMSGTISAGVAHTSNLLVLELPYEGNALAMDVLMPTSGSLAGFESSLTPATLGATLASLAPSSWYVVNLPKFSFSTHVELASVLSGLGMKDVFLEGDADLSGMDGKKDLSVGAVVQQAKVEVDEQGTVAAAGTGVSVCKDCLAISSPPFVTIDRPFVFLVRDLRNGAIAFMGQVVDPAK